MKEILQKEEYKPLKEGSIVEGKVIKKGHLILYLDLGKKTGIIFGKEFLEAKDEIKKLKVGEKVLVKIINLENEEGFVELSLKGAKREMLLKEFEKMKERGEELKVKFQGLNQGGLFTKISDFPAFLPFSQIKEGILPQKLIGKEIKVKILSVLPSGNIILSQKLVTEEIEDLKVGQEVEGEISGITDFGIFLKFGEKEGLIPNSEIEGNFNFKIGEKIKAKIFEISQGKIFLSLKR